MPNKMILPCCAFLNSSDHPAHLTRKEIEERIKRKESPFAWEANYIVESINSPSHLKLLEKYNIPFLFDIHAHFFPDLIMKLIWKWFDSANWAILYRFSEELRLDYLKKNKIYYFTTLNYAHKKDMATGLNDWIFENYKKWKGAIPFGTFFPENGVLSYVKKAIEEYGFKGFKLHCEVSKLDLNTFELANTFDYLEEKQIPIVIHTGHAPLPGEFTGIKHFSKFMKKYPDLKVIVAHMGAYEIEEYAKLLDEYKNLFLDTTMVFVDFLATGKESKEYYPLLDNYSNRILFGSDFPNIPYTLSHPISKLLLSSISDLAKQRILYLNALDLFSMDVNLGDL